MENRDDHHRRPSLSQNAVCASSPEDEAVQCCCVSSRTSDLSLTNSLATSSVVRWLRILRIVHPVSSMFTRRPSESQQAQEPYKKDIWSFQKRRHLLFDYLVHDVFKLHDRDANELIVSIEAVVFHPDVQFIGRHLFLVANNTGGKGKWWSRGQEKQEEEWKNKVDLQVEGLVELWRPIASLLFCLELSLLIGKMWT